MNAAATFALDAISKVKTLTTALMGKSTMVGVGKMAMAGKSSMVGKATMVGKSLLAINPAAVAVVGGILAGFIIGIIVAKAVKDQKREKNKNKKSNKNKENCEATNSKKSKKFKKNSSEHFSGADDDPPEDPYFSCSTEIEELEDEFTKILKELKELIKKILQLSRENLDLPRELIYKLTSLLIKFIAAGGRLSLQILPNFRLGFYYHTNINRELIVLTAQESVTLFSSLVNFLLDNVQPTTWNPRFPNGQYIYVLSCLHCRSNDINMHYVGLTNTTPSVRWANHKSAFGRSLGQALEKHLYDDHADIEIIAAAKCSEDRAFKRDVFKSSYEPRVILVLKDYNFFEHLDKDSQKKILKYILRFLERWYIFIFESKINKK